MTRPCHCDDVDGCVFCDRWYNSEWHRLQWGGAKEPPKKPHQPMLVAPMGSWTHGAGVLHCHYQGTGAGYRSAFGVCHALSAYGLTRLGVRAEAAGISKPEKLTRMLREKKWVTHCVIEAPFLSVPEVKALAEEFKAISFVVRSHSQFGFMTGYTVIVERLRGCQDLKLPNVSLAFNSAKAAFGWEGLYGVPTRHLPNQYPFWDAKYPRKVPNGVLDVGSFGCHRPMKNFITAAAAGAALAKKLSRPYRFHLNVGRHEQEGGNILKMIQDLLAGVGEVVEVPWLEWAEFRQYVAGNLDICLHPSYTETFSIVSSDAIAEGVPVIGSPTIDWLPVGCIADPDDPEAIANAAARTLANPDHVSDGRAALRTADAAALTQWKEFLHGTARPARNRREEYCVHLDNATGKDDGGRVLYQCDAGYGKVRPCVECQKCDGYVPRV